MCVFFTCSKNKLKLSNRNSQSLRRLKRVTKWRSFWKSRCLNSLLRVLRETLSHLFEWVVEFAQDVVLIKDFALVAMLIVVMNFLSHVCWKLVEGHVLLHLFVLGRQRKSRWIAVQWRVAASVCTNLMTVLITSFSESTLNKQQSCARNMVFTDCVFVSLYWGQPCSHIVTVPCPGSVCGEGEAERGRQVVKEK